MSTNTNIANIDDYENWSGPLLVSAIRTLRAQIADETDEVILEHLRIALVAAREALARRNASEIARRLS